MGPWHKGFHWTPQTDKRYAAWLCDRISKVQGLPIENFDDSLSPWFDEENEDSIFMNIWWEFA